MNGRQRGLVAGAALTAVALGGLAVAVTQHGDHSQSAQPLITATPTPEATPQSTGTAPGPSPTPSPTVSGSTPASTSGPTPTRTQKPSPASDPRPTPHLTPKPPTRAVGLALRVSGNHLVNASGSVVQLRGVNRSGTQYACMDGDGVFDGPVDDAAIAAITSWGVNAVRVSLNEDCWLGINGAPAADSGASYAAAIHSFVTRLHAHQLYVILDLHWNAPGTTKATDQEPMPDRDHAPAFWRGVASSFRSDPAVAFDLYNEPFPDSNEDTTAAWRCVQSGGTCAGVRFTAAGMQELLSAVRGTGSRNVVLVGGPQYSGVVDQWLTYAPKDPAHQLAASIHVYGPDYSPCWQAACWNGQIASLARHVPIVAGEIGNIDCTTTVVNPFMDWADAHGVSYLAWAWFVGSCSDEPSLISDYSGTPTSYGIGVRDHLRARR